MPYATPARFIQEYGLDETTQLLADEQNLLTSTLLTDALAGAFTGTPSAAEIAAANAAKDRLLRKLITISNFMDGYLRNAVTLPIATDDANAGTLEDCCIVLTRFDLSDDTDNVTDTMEKRADIKRAWLKDVQAGRVTLVRTTGEEVPSANRVKTGQATSSYDWGAFPPVRRF